MINNKTIFSFLLLSSMNNAVASQHLQQMATPPKITPQVTQTKTPAAGVQSTATPIKPSPTIVTTEKVTAAQPSPMPTPPEKRLGAGTNASFTLSRDGQPALNFNLGEAAKLENNDLLFSIIRNKETLAKIMGRTVLQAELNTLANVRQKIFGDIKVNLDTQYDSYVGKTGTTKKTKLRDHFGSIISHTNTNYPSLITNQRAGKPLKTVEETLQFILDNQLPLDSFFAEVISVLYGLNVHVMTSLSSRPGELKEVFDHPVFVKAAIPALYVLRPGVANHFDKLYPANTSAQAKSATLAPVAHPQPTALKIVPTITAQKLETEKKASPQQQNASFTLSRDGQPALNFNLVEAAKLENNDLLFSIIRNKETLAKIMGRTVLQAELNTLANVRQKIFEDIKANLDTQYDSYVGKTATTKKTKLKDHFGRIISHTNTDYQSLITKQRAGKPLKTVEETLQFILDNQLPLDSFFAEIISVLYGLNVQVMTPSTTHSQELRETLGQPVFVKADAAPLFVFHSGVGASNHFGKLYPANAASQSKPAVPPAQKPTPAIQQTPKPVTPSEAKKTQTPQPVKTGAPITPIVNLVPKTPAVKPVQGQNAQQQVFQLNCGGDFKLPGGTPQGTPHNDVERAGVLLLKDYGDQKNPGPPYDRYAVILGHDKNIGHYVPQSGKIENGDKFTSEAAMRELEEETGGFVKYTSGVISKLPYIYAGKKQLFFLINPHDARISVEAITPACKSAQHNPMFNNSFKEIDRATAVLVFDLLTVAGLIDSGMIPLAPFYELVTRDDKKITIDGYYMQMFGHPADRQRYQNARKMFNAVFGVNIF